MSNTKQWSSATPGYIIFLVDQSGSMSSPYSEGKTKAEFTATVINRAINELININSAGEKVKDRVFISIIGYGSSVNEVRSDYLSKFADSPIRIDSGKQKVSDGNGGLIEIEVQNPIFVEPAHSGGTPMGTAFEMAKKLVAEWMNKKAEHPAPVIINVSDGLPTDTEQKSINIASEIMQLSCPDGSPLIFNAHIGNGAQKYSCSESEAEIGDEQGKFLFSISSKIPDSYKDAARKQELDVKPNSRGFVSNADPETFIKFINFGSSGGSDRK
jgi:hypothetical protein